MATSEGMHPSGNDHEEVESTTETASREAVKGDNPTSEDDQDGEESTVEAASGEEISKDDPKNHPADSHIDTRLKVAHTQVKKSHSNPPHRNT